MQRRDILRGAVAFSVSAPAAIGVISYDPLLSTIRSYQSGMKEFALLVKTEVTDENWDAYEDKTFGPPLARLQQWEGPALTRDGAVEALRLALDDEQGVGGMEASERLVKAVLGFLESLPA